MGWLVICLVFYNFRAYFIQTLKGREKMRETSEMLDWITRQVRFKRQTFHVSNRMQMNLNKDFTC